MALDFSGAPQEQGGSLIPDGTLAWAVIYVRPKAAEFGKILNEGKDNPENKYLDCEIELTSGQFIGRKVFHMLGVEGSERWVNMSRAGIRHILEVGMDASPHNPQGYVIGANLPEGDERMWMDLDGLRCAVKVGVEKGKDGYRDKNRIKQFLSPHPTSDTAKDFAALQGGATSAEPSGRSVGGGQQSGAPAPSWSSAATQPTPALARPGGQSAGGSVMQRSNWTGSPPPAGGAQPATGGQQWGAQQGRRVDPDGEIPF